MDPKELKSLIPKSTKDKVASALGNDFDKISILYQLAAFRIDSTKLSAFQILLEEENFLSYLSKRKNTPPRRFELELELPISRINNHSNPIRIAEIGKYISDTKVLSTYRKFFKQPIDETSAMEFLFHIYRMGEDDLNKILPYSEFFNSIPFYEIRAHFQDIHFQGYRNFLENHRKLYHSRLSQEEIQSNEDFLAQAHVLRAVTLGYYYNESILSDWIFSGFHKGGFPRETLDGIKALDKRYRNPSRTNKKLDQTFYLRTVQSFPVLAKADKEISENFKEFLTAYGNPRDSFQVFVWNEVFRLPQEKIPFLLSLFTSKSFQTLKNSYQTDPKILLFLIRNILTAVSDVKIRNIENGLRKIVLKLLISLKPDKRFLRRRGEFLYVLKKTNSSIALEMEFIRLFFFDYIFEAFHKKGAIDEFHASFLKVVDKEFPIFLTKRPDFSDKMNYFHPLIEEGRQRLYATIYSKYPKYKLELEELIEIAGSTNLDDLFLEEIPKLELNEIPEYHTEVMDAFRRNPAFVKDAALYDTYCAVKLEEAIPYIRSQTLFLVGGIDIIDGVRGAYTYGNAIYLPDKINIFQDSKIPLIENRNLTLYMGLGLHEVAHIIFGSFHFDLNRYIYKLDKPGLFKTIHNIVEDYRIERYMIESNFIYYAEEVIQFMNRVYSVRNWIDEERSVAFLFLTHISDVASGNWEQVIHLKPQAEQRLLGLLSLPLPTGRFRSPKELLENWIERFKNIKYQNPLAAIPLSLEIYEILREWDHEYLHDLDEQEAIDKGTHGGVGSSPPKGIASPNYPQTPLSAEELQEMYEEFNRNPSKYEDLIRENQEGLQKKNLLQPIAEENLSAIEELSYEEEGTIDETTRTKTDDDLAEKKKEGIFGSLKDKLTIKKKGKGKKQSVRSLSPKTKSKTRLNEIKEVNITKKDLAFLKILSTFREVEIAIEKQLARYIRPNQDFDRQLNAYDGELDIEELIEILSGKDKVGFFEFLEADIPNPRKTSLEVVIGMDMSGSTGGIADSSLGLSILDVEKVFALLFGKALEVFADKVHYMGFDSDTATNVYKAKDRLCLSSFHSGGSNRDGDFIRYVKDKLKKSKYELKYFFLLSDGQPSGSNYEGGSALDDTILAMKEVLNEKIRLVYLNIDSIKGSYFEDFAKAATYAEHFSKPTDLIPKIPQLVQTLAKAVY